MHAEKFAEYSFLVVVTEKLKDSNDFYFLTENNNMGKVL